MAQSRITVACVTTRAGYWNLLFESLDRQTFKDFELLVVDAHHGKYKIDLPTKPYPIKHVPDREPNPKRRFGLQNAQNTAIMEASGELIVFVQDFIILQDDALEKYWNLYQEYPDALLTGVDCRVSPKEYPVVADMLPAADPKWVDLWDGKLPEVGEKEFINGRWQDGLSIWETENPLDWELLWAAAPKKILEDLNGFDEEFDDGFGFDNTELALRAITAGYRILVDSSNQVVALNHWKFFPDGTIYCVAERNAPDVREHNESLYVSKATLAKQGQLDPFKGDL